VLDLLYVIYDKFMDIDSIKENNPCRNRFVLSKGHASLGLYAILIENGIITSSELDNWATYESILGGHPDTNKVIGVEASTGSLGHGFPISVGMSLGYKIKNIDGRIITIIGDGECNEGTVWESALLAVHHKLNNLTCIVDFNHSTDRALYLGNIENKFKSFGWKCITINGHNHEEIYDALNIHDTERPIAIIANTIKGYGCKPMEGDPSWHHKYPTKEELPELLKLTY
jgi:transketolase